MNAPLKFDSATAEVDQAAIAPLPNSRKLLAVVPGAGHNDAMRGPAAAEAYRRFLDTALGARRRVR